MMHGQKNIKLRRYAVASCINRILFGYINIHLFTAWSLIFSILIWVELKSIYLIYPNALSVVDTKWLFWRIPMENELEFDIWQMA